MSDFINQDKLAVEVMNAIDNCLKGEARRIYIDSYEVASPLVVEFVKKLGEALNNRFQN